MARGFHRGRGVAVTRTRRLNAWVGSADQGVVAVAGNGSSIVESNATLTNTTVVRTRGVFSIQPQAFAADLTIVGAYGIGIVSDVAFAAGAASIPGPYTDKDWGGWFVWEAFSYRFEFADATGILIASITKEIDSKAMRKVKSDETVVVMCESQAAALNVVSNFRMMVKLS